MESRTRWDEVVAVGEAMKKKFEAQIPAMSQLELEERLTRAFPMKDRRFIDLATVHPTDVSFIWSPGFIDKGGHGGRVNKALLRRLGHSIPVRTLHRYGYYSFFKPSLAECLAFLPAELNRRGQAFAFSVQGPETATDLNEESEALNAGFHVAVTTFWYMR